MATKRIARTRRHGATRKGRRSIVIVKPTIDARLLLKGLAMLLMVAGFGLLLTKAGDILERPVRQVSVQGDFKYLAQEQVVQAVMPHIQNDYLTVPLGELREALEALPWVDEAAVKRDWPDGLVIAVTEETPIAWWGGDSLIDNKGRVFAPERVKVVETLPYLEGPVGSQAQVMERYIDLGSLLKGRDMIVQSMRLSPRGAWSAALKSDVELVFGRDKVVEKLQRFLAMYDLSLKSYMADIKRIDLRYQNGLAVQWRQQPGTHK